MKNRKGFGTLSLLIILGIIVTILVYSITYTGFLSRGTASDNEKGQILVTAQNVFSVVDIVVEEQVAKIYDEVLLGLKTEIETVGMNSGATEPDHDDSNPFLDQENPEDENPDIIGEVTQEQLEQAIRQIWAKLPEMSTPIGYGVSQENQVLRQVSGIMSANSKLEFYRFDKTKNYFVNDTPGVSAMIQSSEDIGFKVILELRDEHNNRLDLAKYYYLSMDEQLKNLGDFESESLIHGVVSYGKK